MDNEILNLIVNLGEINSNDIVLEVGPGTGNLTEKILKKKPKKVIVVEKDKNLSELLKKKFNNTVEVINNDILNYNNQSLYKKKNNHIWKFALQYINTNINILDKN